MDNLATKVYATNPAPRELLVQYLQLLGDKARALNSGLRGEEGAHIAGDIQHILLQQSTVNWEGAARLTHIETLAGELSTAPNDQARWKELLDRIQDLPRM